MVKPAPEIEPPSDSVEPSARSAPYDARSEAREILRTTTTGALATLDPGGFPFATLVTSAADHDGSPILLTSALSAHSRNMQGDPRVSLLLSVGGKGDPLAHPRLTLVGEIALANDANRSRLRARFLARRPKAALYADFADFSFWRLEPRHAHFNGGFAKAGSFAWADLRCEMAGADALIEAEPGALAHLNADHCDALDLYAEALAGQTGRGWRAAAIDPEGLDLFRDDRNIRIAFPTRVLDPGALRKTLVDLAERARKAKSESGAASTP